jgi:nitroreductase
MTNPTTIPPAFVEATDWLLSTTRAVRKRLDLHRPVDPEVILDCLRLAVQAPTGSNSQGWRWIVVTDPDKRAKIAEYYRSGGRAYLERLARAEAVSAATSALLDASPAAAGSPDAPDSRASAPARAHHDAQMARVRASSGYLLDVIDRVPAMVIPCIRGRLTRLEDAAGFFGSIHPAIWSLALALRSRGLGSVWTTFHLAHEQETAELLGIPPNVTQAALLPIAYTRGTDFRPADRRPVEEITYWDSWGETR